MKGIFFVKFWWSFFFKLIVSEAKKCQISKKNYVHFCSKILTFQIYLWINKEKLFIMLSRAQPFIFVGYMYHRKTKDHKIYNSTARSWSLGSLTKLWFWNKITEDKWLLNVCECNQHLLFPFAVTFCLAILCIFQNFDIKHFSILLEMECLCHIGLGSTAFSHIHKWSSSCSNIKN